MKSCPVTHSTMCLTASPPSAAQNSIFNIHVHGYGSWPIMVHQLQQAQKQHLQHPCSWLWQLAHYCPPASTGSKTASPTLGWKHSHPVCSNTHVHSYGSWPIIVHQLQQAQKQHLQHPCSWLWQLVHYCPPASTGSKTASSTPMFMVMAAGQLLSPSFNRLKNSIFNIHIHGDVSWPIIPKASAQ